MSDQDFGHLCRGRRIQISRRSDLGCFGDAAVSSNLTWVFADTASAVGSLAVTFISFDAVICDTDQPCSVNTA